MTIVTAQMSVSVDGFYAGPEHTGPQPWLEGPEAAGFFRVTRWVIDAEAWRQRRGFKGGENNTNSQVIAETFEQAGAAANGKNVAIAGGGTLLRQVIKLGLLDELELHVVPVILGTGMRLLSPELGLDDMEGSSSSRPGSSPPPTSRTSATRSATGARSCSTTEDGTRNPPPPRHGGHWPGIGAHLRQTGHGRNAPG